MGNEIWISALSLLVAAASFAWTIYNDRKLRQQQKTLEVQQNELIIQKKTLNAQQIDLNLQKDQLNRYAIGKIEEEALASKKAVLSISVEGDTVKICNNGLCQAKNIKIENPTLEELSSSRSRQVKELNSGEIASFKIARSKDTPSDLKVLTTWDDDHKEGNKRVQNIYFR